MAHPQFTHLRILGIAGSLREGSYSHRVLEYMLALAQRMRVEAEPFDLREHPLPMCSGDNADPYADFPAVAVFRRKVTQANALILVTPEYHGGMSGVLKNAIDLLDFEHLEGKVVGCISVLGGMSNSNALNDLRHVLRSCHAWVIPQQIAIERVRHVFASGQICDPEMLKRLEDFVAGLLWSTVRLSPEYISPLYSPSAVATRFQEEVSTGVRE